MMQKDEDLLLEPWLLYYGYLFGFENLTVFDNGSSSDLVKSILQQFEVVGVTIIRHFSTETDWVQKGDLFKSVIKRWDNSGEYDFAFPLDCDEFLSLYTNAGLTCARHKIHAYLDGLIGRDEILSIDTSHFNVPGRAGWYAPTRGSKRFFSADTIGDLDHGFHIATSRKSDGIYQTLLTHLHFHNKPYAMLIEHAKRKLARFVNVDDTAAVLAFNGPGAHLVKHFRLSEAEYMSQYDEKITFGFTGLNSLLAALGTRSQLFQIPVACQSRVGESHSVTIHTPPGTDGLQQCILFDGRAYLDHYIDVAAAGVNPLYHYLTLGMLEARSVFDAQLRQERPMVWV